MTDHPRDENNDLISSDRVDGTPVYAADGERIGKIHHLMVGKRNGRVEYAVMSCGGFLGMGEEYRPVPWDALQYDTDRGGYLIRTDKDRIAQAPSFAQDREPDWDRDYGTTVHTYYGIIY